LNTVLGFPKFEFGAAGMNMQCDPGANGSTEQLSTAAAVIGVVE